jgi:transposase
LPASLPRRVIVHEPRPEDLFCGTCQEAKVEFAREVVEKVDIEPARVSVVAHVHPKYGCPKCRQGVTMAPMPASVLDKGLAEPGAIAHTVVSKIADHLPLYRQEQILSRSGVHIDRNTLQDWFDAAAHNFAPLVAFMKRNILSGSIIQSDDTRVQVLKRPKGSYTGYLWCYISPLGEVVYDFTQGRGGEGPKSFLAGYRGYLQADAYAGYDQIFTNGPVTEVGCLAHARRKFFEARDCDPDHVDPIMKVIGELYRVERKARDEGLDEKKRGTLRQERSRPLMATLHELLLSTRTAVLPKSPVASAIGYALNQWVALNRFLEDGRLEIDNNSAERALRGIAVGRSNWLFAGSAAGGQRAATLYSIVETCRRQGIDPYRYMRDVLGKLPTWPNKKIEDLTPRGWKMAFPELAAAAATAVAA